MDLVVNVDILGDVMTLMNPTNEAKWHRGGIFKKAASLGVDSGT